MAALPKRKKIYYYELLWPVLASFIWSPHFVNTYNVFYEDNMGAQFSLLSGFSSNFAASLFLALFWGAAAQTSRPWIDRLSSGDNPADCLTKPGQPMQHLDGAIFEDDRRFEPIWELLILHSTSNEARSQLGVSSPRFFRMAFCPFASAPWV